MKVQWRLHAASFERPKHFKITAFVDFGIFYIFVQTTAKENNTFMGIFFFYNNRKPRRFNYTPILYDPEKEARKERMEKRVREIKRELDIPMENEPLKKTEFKSEFVSQTKHLKKRKEREDSGENVFFTSNTTLVIILIILFGLFFFWLLR